VTELCNVNEPHWNKHFETFTLHLKVFLLEKNIFQKQLQKAHGGDSDKTCLGYCVGNNTNRTNPNEARKEQKEYD
jgi:hypothetical protein